MVSVDIFVVSSQFKGNFILPYISYELKRNVCEIWTQIDAISQMPLKLIKYYTFHTWAVSKTSCRQNYRSVRLPLTKFIYCGHPSGNRHSRLLINFKANRQ